ncbi:MAG: hypothetical protein GTO53_03595 [Planctomycetales bacterium]|nr:hypothetical protein [Planctomycetales bacterium]NIM08247.1 hypothetical protein [Planctomycetales bacterium]NIN07742.1 hypothetical protein [Planctomycetales bacterium]NIN76865.1 hypothetical protein [Planctomycetales bacterium]NIO34061.1 hypothetical protein [Planctomycetales bacterium]
MPLELWVRAVHSGLRIVELAIPLVYLDEKRSFGGALDEGSRRMAYYQQVIKRSLVELGRSTDQLACGVMCEESAG